MASETKPLYKTDEEVEEVVRGFESCETRPAEFDHRAHLTVALCYALRLSDEEALERMRDGLGRFIHAHGVDPKKYHETLTVFWLKRVRAFAGRAGSGRTLFELANELVAECGDARLAFDYYSRQLIDSDGARRSWVAPDLRPMDF
jgi:hypothetical protein